MDASVRSLKKGYLKNLPVWKEVDGAKEKSEQLIKRLDAILNEQKLVDEELEKLPNLNLRLNLRVNEKSDSNETTSEDVVSYYVKNESGDYVKKVEHKVDTDISNGREISLKKLKDKIMEGDQVYAMISPTKPWVKCHVIAVYQKRGQYRSNGYSSEFHLQVIETKEKIRVSKYSVALIQDHENCLEEPKRIIGGSTMDNMFPGTLCFQPKNHNKFRYLVMMDDGSACYLNHKQIFPILGQSEYPWSDARLCLGTGNIYNEYYLIYYLLRFPRRNLLILKQSDFNNRFQLYRNGNLVTATIVSEDCDIFFVKYDDGTSESIYKGSLRILTKEHEKLIPSTGPYLKLSEKDEKSFYYQIPLNCKEYYDAGCTATYEDIYKVSEDFGDIKVSRSRYQTVASPDSPQRVKVRLDDDLYQEVVDLEGGTDSETSSDNGPNTGNHQCNSDCLNARGGRNESTVKDIVSEFRKVSDLRVPLLLGWKHEIKETHTKTRAKLTSIYEAPCGKVFKTMYAIKRYLLRTRSKLDIDYFTDDPEVDIHSKRADVIAYWEDPNMASDYHTGQPLENKNILAVNQCSEERLPFDFRYAAKSFLHPRLIENGLTLNEEFKSGCDCEDDCEKTASCACHKLTVEAYGKSRGHAEAKYLYKRLKAGIIRTGIYECNSLCKCSSKCPNRVVSNGIRFRFQVTKTPAKGWGLVCLDDIPPFSFVCTYSAEILDDADKYGDDDMYFADMDYVTINEAKKLGEETDDDERSESGVESDSTQTDETEESSNSFSKDDNPNTDDKIIVIGSSDDSDNFESTSAINGKKRSKILKQSLIRKKLRKKNNRKKPAPAESPRFKRIHDILGTHDFTLDARISGNIGRFCNHSCEPNCQVQNVFLETHDLRYPVPALFSNRTIKAMEEITWDYGYRIGSIPGREITCSCGAKTCKGRIL